MPTELACNRISFGAALVLAAGIVAGIVVPAGPGWDFANFYDAGHKILAGQIAGPIHPAALIEGRAPEGHLAYYGTPVSALLFAPLAWVPPSGGDGVFKSQGAIAILDRTMAAVFRQSSIAEKSGLGTLPLSGPISYRRTPVPALLDDLPRRRPDDAPVCLAFVSRSRALTSGRHFGARFAMVLVVAIKPAFVLADPAGCGHGWSPLPGIHDSYRPCRGRLSVAWPWAGRSICDFLSSSAPE